MKPASYPVPPGVRTPCESRPEWFFPPQGNYATQYIEAAKHMCGGCQFRDGCAAWGITRGEAGVWGETTENERKAIRKRLKIVAVPVEMPRMMTPRRQSASYIDHGSYGAISRHRQNGEPLCDACREFSRESKRRQRAKRRETAGRADRCALATCGECGLEMLPQSLPRHRLRKHSEAA